MILPEYTKLGCTPSLDNIAGAGRTSTALSKNPDTDGGLLTEILTEHLPGGAWGLRTTTTLIFDKIEQFTAVTAQTWAVQFCIRGKNPDPAIDRVEPAYTLLGLDG